MIDYSGSWYGRIFGTNSGTVEIEVQQSGESLRGTVNLADAIWGINEFSLTGTAGEPVSLSLEPTSLPEGVESGTVTVVASLDGDGPGFALSLLMKASSTRFWYRARSIRRRLARAAQQGDEADVE